MIPKFTIKEYLRDLLRGWPKNTTFLFLSPDRGIVVLGQKNYCLNTCGWNYLIFRSRTPHFNPLIVSWTDCAVMPFHSIKMEELNIRNTSSVDLYIKL